MDTQTARRTSAVLLTPVDAAWLANVSRATVYREIERGARPVRHVGHQLRIEPAEFARYRRATRSAVRPGSRPRESPESRLLAAGFTRRLEFWCPPGEQRALSLNDAIAALDAGEIQPPHLDWPGVHPDVVVVRAEIRAALKAEAGRKAQEPKP